MLAAADRAITLRDNKTFSFNIKKNENYKKELIVITGKDEEEKRPLD